MLIQLQDISHVLAMFETLGYKGRGKTWDCWGPQTGRQAVTMESDEGEDGVTDGDS